MKKYGTILVVDDNPAVLTALKYCLTDMFETVCTLPAPEGILTLMAQQNVEMVLLDMNFSTGVNTGRDGLTWLQALRKHHPETPVVLITAYADVELAVRGLKGGAADFVTKPWDNQELKHKLQDVMEAKRHVSTLEEVEQEHIMKALDKCQNNMKLAAEMLGVSRQTLYNKLKSFGLRD